MRFQDGERDAMGMEVARWMKPGRRRGGLAAPRNPDGERR